MRTFAVTGLTLSVALLASPPRAEASHCGPDCLPFLEPVAWAMGAGFLGLYAGGTIYYVGKDLSDEPRSSSYYGSELILHGSLGGLFAGATIDAARDGNIAGTLAMGSFAGLHLTLARNGLNGLYEHRGELHPNSTVVTWTAGTLVGLNAAIWTSGMSERHGRTYGITEVAVNAPLALGFAMLARDRFSDNRGGPGLGYGALAALSTLYIADGLRTIAHPHRTAKLDLLGTDLAPTIVSDGHEIAPGVGTARSF